MISILRHNLWMKLLSVALALAVWGYMRGSDPVQKRDMQVEVSERLAPGTALVSRVPAAPTVTVYATGPTSRLVELRESDPKAVLDARDIRLGETQTVRPQLASSIPGVSVDFQPDSFELTVDRLMRSEFPPEEVAEGHLPTGHFIDSRIGLPRNVSIEGAAPLVERVARVVYYLNLSLLEGSTELSVSFQPLDANDSVVRNLVIIPPAANISIGLQPSQASKTVPVVVDYQGTPAANYALTSVSYDPTMVEVSGAAEVLADVLNVHTAPINLTGKTSSFEQSVALRPPTPEVGLSVSRATVSVDIEQISGGLTFEGILIDPRGMDPRLTYDLSPERIDVTIHGGVHRLAAVTADLIRPQVDLSELGPGTHQVRVSVALPSGVRLDNLDPGTVTVIVGAHERAPEEPQSGEVAEPEGEEEHPAADEGDG